MFRYEDSWMGKTLEPWLFSVETPCSKEIFENKVANSKISEHIITSRTGLCVWMGDFYIFIPVLGEKPPEQ